MKKNCVICNHDQAVYKCPNCRNSYCSVACCKEHKTIGCTLPESQAANDNENFNEMASDDKYNFPTEDTVPVERLRELGESREVKECIKNLHVRRIMTAILKDPNPTKTIASAMKEPIFVELADVCLKVAEAHEEELCQY